MSSTVTLTTWDEFLKIPDALHFFIQTWLVHWLTAAASGKGRAAREFPYRPATNLQFWKADVAYATNEDWQRLRGDDYPVYSPPLIIEVLSPSNEPAKIERQRIAAFSGGTTEFWLIDSALRLIEVSKPGSAPQTYGPGETIPVSVLPGVRLPLDLLSKEVASR